MSKSKKSKEQGKTPSTNSMGLGDAFAYAVKSIKNANGSGSKADTWLDESKKDVSVADAGDKMLTKKGKK